ncbi:hypothetical protein WN48_08696 [Eufriesea mexicana]|uniref:uncharacterized protein LOC108545980 n=1 Tax=Eufriesea mexicana TaxID=516756 RepID=UPI00083BABF5|nr:PREDICTED: uncharacterized protein LOC108545980 [Eufriesea mexicana]XP_017753357.1 PREDICTED: uncharacterized protein LOC108545980 [Eufriesea mexicana]XP_017753358.1 PREDICTED: uncharacterized protein LOC108545980 [Eufriesea mexicana]XP_017753360.1 PREDICTED: uncharacterized protein LOC108545980 [Eufriesea mexicana]XP_017753361.1 PREDICTED: uncharacterized protein LOC108545980 [Eufriesea mexicana]OAD59588.1 hypothetical protein WN48_08696 [Eufriesea mexicana]
MNPPDHKGLAIQLNELRDARIKRLEELRNGRLKFTKESFDVFQNCMKTTAIYYYGIPCGVASAVLLQHFLPKMRFRNMAIISGSLISYLFGKFSAVSKCYMESCAFLSDDSAKTRQQSLYTVDDDNNSDQQNEEDKHLLPFDDVPKESSTWDYHDSQFESYSNELNDTSDNLQEEAINIQQGKKRVTYDELWKEHRLKELQTNNYGLNYGREKLFETQKKREKMEPITPETEFEKNDNLSN